LNGVIVVVIVILALIAGLGIVAYVVYQKKLRRAKAIERGLKMVPLLIHLPPPTSDTDAGSRDIREVMREKTAQAEVLYNLIAGTAKEGFKSRFYGQRHIALEIIATDGLIHYYAAVPVAMVGVVENAIISSYPGARIEEAEDHNIFSEKGKLIGTMGGEIVLKANAAYPIANYSQMERDPMEAMLSAMSGIQPGDGAAIQIMIRPADKNWVKRSLKIVAKKRRVRSSGVGFGAADLAKAAIKAPSEQHANKPELSNLELANIEAVENKTKQPGFEVLIRIVVSTESVATSQGLIQKLATAFALFEQPGLNGFRYLPASNAQGLVTAFILRFFPPPLKDMVLNTEELATLFHIPDSQFISTTNVERQQTKQVDGPTSVPTAGLLLGYNEFRGVKKEIRLSDQDRRRHTYIIGQTGTGKSTMLENLVAQDLMSGKGFAFIDPHGDTAEKFMGMIPKERAEDVIYFNPGDMADPLGLNLFEFTDPLQKDFLIQESLGMLYKIYDPDKTGIIGPRFEQWYRNAALTLMSDPNGATFIEIPKVFTDTEYLKNKFKYLKDPTVIEFWTKEMGQTSEYHKSEMLGFFVSKFGAFQQNEMMRNIIGQTESSFNMRDIMDKKKILIVNLSKGKIGELNSKLLGMMFVIKFQAAAMSRADMPEADRSDFCLYVDEFQNFSTDSFASILSEARKYRLNLIVANQFIGQLTPEIRDAVFGNVGTIVAHRTGPEDAEFMVKQFAPVFDTRDIINIPNFKSAVRLMIGGLPSQPFSMNDLPPVAGENIELAAAMKELSAAKYGHPRAQVEADITARLTNKPVGIVQAPSIPTPLPSPVVVPDALAPAPSSVVDSTPVSTPVPSATPEPVVSAVVIPPAVVPPAAHTLNISDFAKKAPVESSEEIQASAPAVPKPTPVQSHDGIITEAQNEIDSLLNLNTKSDAPEAVVQPLDAIAAAPVATSVSSSVAAHDVPLVPLSEAEAVTEEEATSLHESKESSSNERVAPLASSKHEEKTKISEPKPFVPRGAEHTIDHAHQNTPQETKPPLEPAELIEAPEPTPVPAPAPDPIPADIIEAETPVVLAANEPIAEAQPEVVVAEQPINENIKAEEKDSTPAEILSTDTVVPTEAASVLPAEIASVVNNLDTIAETMPEVSAANISGAVAIAPVMGGDIADALSVVPGATLGPAAAVVDAPAAEVDPAIASLAPGEIYVDDNGIVHQG
jgi:hypothetical protein